MKPLPTSLTVRGQGGLPNGNAGHGYRSPYYYLESKSKCRRPPAALDASVASVATADFNSGTLSWQPYSPRGSGQRLPERS